jgi:hypothetical protein
LGNILYRRTAWLSTQMKRTHTRYVSSDLRGPGDSLNAPLKEPDGLPRQPYRYENGLLEIPSVGWQDTAFSGTSKTPTSETSPRTYKEIMSHYRDILRTARQIALENNRDYFLGLVLHPYDNAIYNHHGCFFYDLCEIVTRLGGSFYTYGDVSQHYDSTLLE